MSLKKLIILLTISSISVLTKGQESLPKDYFNKTVQIGQKSTTYQFRLFLERNLPDSALTLIDNEYLKNNPNIKKEITIAANTISRIYEKCLPRGETITYENNQNVLSSYYTIPPSPQYALWLYFNEGDKDSKIIKVILKNKKVLDAERAKRNRKKESNSPPPPPPVLK